MFDREFIVATASIVCVVVTLVMLSCTAVIVHTLYDIARVKLKIRVTDNQLVSK